MTLNYHGLPRLVWNGDLSSYSKEVISFLRAHYMIEKGFLSYLTRVCDFSKDSSKLKATRLVREFMDVFPTKLKELKAQLEDLL